MFCTIKSLHGRVLTSRSSLLALREMSLHADVSQPCELHAASGTIDAVNVSSGKITTIARRFKQVHKGESEICTNVASFVRLVVISFSKPLV
jgi:hypothetical protein